MSPFSGIVDSFTYCGDGQRVQKRDSTGTTNHVWDGQNILLETNASNAIQVVYTLDPALYGNLISQSRGGVDSFYLFDALGSARQLAGSSGSVTDTYLYDSFGDILLRGTTTNSFLYVGRLGYYNDADTSTYYLRMRVYAQVVGRFWSRDPLVLSVIGANAYALRSVARLHLRTRADCLHPTARAIHASSAVQKLRIGLQPRSIEIGRLDS